MDNPWANVQILSLLGKARLGNPAPRWGTRLVDTVRAYSGSRQYVYSIFKPLVGPHGRRRRCESLLGRPSLAFHTEGI